MMIRNISNYKKEKKPPRKRLCFLMPVHPFVGKGGAEYQAGLVLEAITKKESYEIHFMAHRIPIKKPKDHKIWKVGFLNNVGRFGALIDIPFVYFILKLIKPQVIYQNVGCTYTGVATFYAKRHNAKLVWHVASDSDVEYNIAERKKSILNFIDRMILDYGIKNAGTIIAQTRLQGKLLEKYFNRKCSAYIPVGSPCPNSLNNKTENITILWVANIKPLKQPEVFVMLAKRISKKTNANFIMVGQPKTSRKRLHLLLGEINKTKNLTYLGGVSQSEVNQLLEKGHILVNTSQYEGFSNTFVQAWMRKVPVVSLNSDPDDVLVKENIGFHSSNFEQLCADVELLINDNKTRDQMGERARNYAIANHTSEKMIHRILTVLDSI